SSGTATTSFTDNVGTELEQCQNINLKHLSDPCGTEPAKEHPEWAQGDVNGSNSQYREGDGLPYRSPITGLTNGTWVIRLGYDFSKGGIPAIDRLTSFNLTQASNPCLSAKLKCSVGSPAFTFEIPGEAAGASGGLGSKVPVLPNSGNLTTWEGTTPTTLNAISGSRKMTVWQDAGGGKCTAAFVSAGQNSPEYNDGLVAQSGLATGDSERSFRAKVTVSGCGSGDSLSLMLGWSGH